MIDPPSDAAPLILDDTGQPARRRADRRCPQCGADPDQRQLSGGFGAAIHDVCRRCGYAFTERTAEPSTRKARL